MICDSHIHFIPPELSVYTSFYKGVWIDKKALYDFLERNNVKKSLLVYPSTDAHLKLGSYKEVCRLYNDAMEGIMNENDRIVASAIVDLNDSEYLYHNVKELNNRGFRVISLASSYEGQFQIDKLKNLFQAAQEFNMFFFVHPQTINPIGFERVKDPLLMPVLEYSFDISVCLGLFMVEGLLEDFDVKVIFSSLGGVVPFLKERFDRVYLMLRKRGMVKDLGKLPSEILSRVYVDTSGASLKNIELALELFGEDRLLWGSDYPVNSDIHSNLVMLDVLGKDIKEKIVCNNLLELLNG